MRRQARVENGSCHGWNLGKMCGCPKVSGGEANRHLLGHPLIHLAHFWSEWTPFNGSHTLLAQLCHQKVFAMLSTSDIIWCDLYARFLVEVSFTGWVAVVGWVVGWLVCQFQAAIGSYCNMISFNPWFIGDLCWCLSEPTNQSFVDPVDPGLYGVFVCVWCI